MTAIGELAFYGAESLATINYLPGSVTTLGASCFSKTSLVDFPVPDQITTINDKCFQDCVSLVSFTVGQSSSLSFLGQGVFQGCVKLEVAKANNANFISESGALFNSARTTLIVFPPASKTRLFSIPDKVETISMSAFYGCSNLELILIPEDGALTTIGVSAFEGCIKLKTLNIPKTVSNILNDAFKDCKSLQCGQIVELNDDIAVENLLSSAKFPKKAINPCLPHSCMRVLVKKTTNVIYLGYGLILFR